MRLHNALRLHVRPQHSVDVRLVPAALAFKVVQHVLIELDADRFFGGWSSKIAFSCSPQKPLIGQLGNIGVVNRLCIGTLQSLVQGLDLCGIAHGCRQDLKGEARGTGFALAHLLSGQISTE